MLLRVKENDVKKVLERAYGLAEEHGIVHGSFVEAGWKMCADGVLLAAISGSTPKQLRGASLVDLWAFRKGLYCDPDSVYAKARERLRQVVPEIGTHEYSVAEWNNDTPVDDVKEALRQAMELELRAA